MKWDESLPHVALLIFIAREIYNWVKDRNSSFEKTLAENTVALNELRYELNHFKIPISEIPQIKADVREAQFHIKALQERF